MKNRSLSRQLLNVLVSSCLFTSPCLYLTAADAARTFPTPEAAVAALREAVGTTNRAALSLLFGGESDALVNPDEVQGSIELANFTAAFNQNHRLVPDSASRATLEVGPDAWPFPIPLVKRDGMWQFDTAGGVQELLNRRIGRNELEVLRVMRAYVEAQREYATQDRDGDGVLEYAQTISSTPGKTDGLYWPPELNGEISPLGPLAAHAQQEGYFGEDFKHRNSPQPFHGYLFRILTRQGKHPPGGKYAYIINGNMIGGFAMVAWPAEYGESGVMTFVVNQQGRVFQKDLGKRTSRIAGKMSAYDPDASWTLSSD